jgi:hypothetical protein
LRAVPQDLGILFQAYESLASPSRDILDDALTALQISIEVRNQLPSVALMALWTAVERLCDLDRRFLADGEKRAKVAKKTRPNVSVPQEGILAMAETLLGVKSGGFGELAKTLERVREIRNNWAHDGRLGAKDLSTQPEIWVAHTSATTPSWAQSGNLLGTMSQLARRLMIALLRRELARAAGRLRPPDNRRVPGLRAP